MSEYNDFLDELRASGVVNMWGAGTYLEEVYGMTREEAKTVLIDWMKSFNDRGSSAPISHQSKENTMAKLVVAPKPAPEAAKPAKAPRVQEPAPKADGTNCFEGTIGGAKYLFDAANGEALLELVAGTPIADQAAAAKRTLVPRSKASKYAVNLLFRQWRAAKNQAATPA